MFNYIFLTEKAWGPGDSLLGQKWWWTRFFEKSRLVRVMAERCLAGDFGGSYYLAAKEPECVELGIIHKNIQYHMDKIDQEAAAARAADRARVDSETAAATVMMNGMKPTFVFVERGGSASAAAAVSEIIGKLESDMESHIGEVVHLARCEASAAHQAKLQAAEVETSEIKKKLCELKARQSERETEARRLRGGPGDCSSAGAAGRRAEEG